MDYGYIRVSTKEQNTDRQMVALQAQSEIEPGPLAVKAQSLNCWTTKEFPQVVLKNR